MTSDYRNMITAVVLSLIVVVGWQYFIVGPQSQRAAQQVQIAAQQQAAQQQAAGQSATFVTNDATNLATPGTNAQAVQTTQPVSMFSTRKEAIAQDPRITIDTAALTGSINLVGGRIDDLSLKNYRETVEPDSPIISLLSPSTTKDGYYVEQGWVNAAGSAKVPNSKTKWSVNGNQVLSASNPVTLTYDNGQGLVFSRKIEVDNEYLFTVTQTVKNSSNSDVSLFPYSRVARFDKPEVSGYFILHEGPIGVLGDANLVEKSYKDLRNDGQIDIQSKGGWLGFTDKYWAAAVLPVPGKDINARFSWTNPGQRDVYQTSFVDRNPTTISSGASASNKSYVFAGAKVESIINKYQKAYGFDRIELLIDWGWFYFITQPMFYVIRWLHGILGNFGLAILSVTVLVKLLFFPLANRSFASMAAMRKVQPEIKALQERFKDDRAELQKATMELYQREKINPISGCWPVLIQIPVFFSLYKVLFVTIEMRQAPFFGWIKDLAAPDPTHIFNLFGLLPYDPTALPVVGSFLAIGIWPVIMGITMWVQMKLNPPPTEPTQQMIFGLLPILFTFMLGRFPAGLVIYWAWNNTLSVTQQYIIMRRHGVTVNLFENIISTFKRKKPPASNDKK